jgi:radical SAM protein with 4Fe4S-binding SPASM domain
MTRIFQDTAHYRLMMDQVHPVPLALPVHPVPLALPVLPVQAVLLVRHVHPALPVLHAAGVVRLEQHTLMTFPNEPFFLQWHITDLCNLRCKHCYCTDYRLSGENDKKMFYVLDEYEKLLKYLKKNGRVQFAGGEPLLSPDIYTLIKEARNRNMAVRILSNGTLITDEIAQKLKDAGCYILQISIEGRKKINDKIRAKGSFKKALLGAEKLKSNGFEVTFAMTLSKINYREISYVFKLADKYANRIGFHRLIPIGTGKELENEMLSKDELLIVHEIIFKLKKKYQNLDVPLRDPLWRAFFYNKNNNTDKISGCSAGYNGLCIGSNGDVFPCRRLPIKIGNVYEHSLVDLWNHAIMVKLRARDKRDGYCGACNSKWLCGGCPGISYALSGNYMGEDIQCYKGIK